MKLEQIDARKFDQLVDRISADQPEEQAQNEIRACSDIAEYSRVIGNLSRTARRILENSPSSTTVLHLFASLLSTGVRFGWNLRITTQETELLDGMLAPEVAERLRSEIAEAGTWD
jgi:hypothetical protein